MPASEDSPYIGWPDITTNGSKRSLLMMVSSTWKCNIWKLKKKWFANWDMGGAYWEKQNPVAQRTFANSPHLFVEKWDTPILCIHGAKDYRILANKDMAAFDAAVMRGVPAELDVYKRQILVVRCVWVLTNVYCRKVRKFLKLMDKNIFSLSLIHI